MTATIPTSDELLALEARRIDAMIAADVVTLDALLLDDCRYVHSNGSIDSKESYLAKLRSGASRYLRIDASEQHVQVRGESSVVTSLLSFDVQGGGTTRALRVLAVAVWQRTDAGPRLAFFQATLAPPA